MKIKKKIDMSAQVMMFPSLVVILLFTVYPIIWAFISSFKRISLVRLQMATLFQVPGNFVGLENYMNVLKNDLFWKSLWNTSKYGVIYVPMTLVISLLLALLVNQKLRGINFFRSAIFLPYVVSLVSASLIFMTLFDGSSGIVNYLLSFIGVQGKNWLATTEWAMVIVAFLGSWTKIGYYTLFFLAGLQNIPSQIYESAEIDGAGKITQFFKLTLPLLEGIIAVVLILLLRDVLLVFQEVYIMTGGGPANSTVTVPFLIYNEAFAYMRIGTASAISFILFGLAVIVALIQHAVMRKTLR